MLGFIGRLDSQKGYDLLLESLIEVLEDRRASASWIRPVKWVLQ